MRLQRTRNTLIAAKTLAKELLHSLRKQERHGWGNGIKDNHVCKLGSIALHGAGSQTKVFLQPERNLSAGQTFLPSFEDWAEWNGLNMKVCLVAACQTLGASFDTKYMNLWKIAG